jgi:hypothetical protein
VGDRGARRRGATEGLFGALFASADAAFRDLADRALLDDSLAEIPQRVALFGLTAGLVLAAAHVALSPH